MFALGTSFYLDAVGLSSLIFMMIYVASFALSWGPVVWVMLAEMYPNNIRSTAMAIAVAVQWAANYLVSWTFPIMDKHSVLNSLFNHGFSYWLYAVMSILAAVFVWKMVPETKQKSLEEMERMWR